MWQSDIDRISTYHLDSLERWESRTTHLQNISTFEISLRGYFNFEIRDWETRNRLANNVVIIDDDDVYLVRR